MAGGKPILMKKTQILSPTDPHYQLAAQCLQDNGLVSFPTETVYGLGANALSDQAMTGIFQAKSRPHFNPLIIHLACSEDAEKWANMTDLARQAAAAFWPGPVTLIVPRRTQPYQGQKIGLMASAGLDTIALRVPDGEIAQKLLTISNLPLAAPSANPSGKLSPTRAEHVMAGLSGRIDYILDGGACAIGLESTILDVSGTQPILLRQGGKSVADLEAVLGPISFGDKITQDYSIASPARAPGMLSSHYAPEASVRLAAQSVKSSESLLAFGEYLIEGADQCQKILNLSPHGNLAEAASNLFQYLRDLDQGENSKIAVMPIPETGLGAAINDRLRRAAAPRH